MKCDEARDLLSSFHDGELSESLAESVRTHLNNCEKCSAEIRLFEKMGRLFRESPPSEVGVSSWSTIVDKLNEPPRRLRIQGFRWSRRWFPAVVAASLLAATAVGYWIALRTSGRNLEHVAAAHVFKTLNRFPGKPSAVMDELAAQYQGKQVSLELARESLGYVPVVSKIQSPSYQVVSTHVLKMPCCKCPASLCSREDGTEFLIFEHDEEQPRWFGDSPVISTNCGGLECRCAQLPEQLAVTWKVGPRFVTAIGVKGIDEIVILMGLLMTPGAPA